MMTKRLTILTVLLFPLAGFLFAGGRQEVQENPSLETEENGLRIEQVLIQGDTGVLKVVLDKVSYNGSVYTKGIVLQQCGGETAFFKPNGATFFPADSEELADFFTLNSPRDFEVDKTAVRDTLLSSEYDIVSVPLDILYQIPDADQSVEMIVPEGEAALSVLLSDDSGSNGLVLKLSTSLTDLFENEKAALEELFPGESAENQRALLLGAHIYNAIQDKGGDIADFETYADLFGLDSLAVTALFPAGDTLTGALKELKSYLAVNFKDYYFEDGDIDHPYLGFSHEDFQSLYENEGSLYVRDYLKFLFDIGKPLFSSYYSGLENSFESGTYNFRKYEPVDADTGMELAKNALRYLNWGVEYTLPDRTGGIDTGSSGNRVFSSLLEEDGQDPYSAPWLQGSEGDRSINYLTSQSEINTDPKSSESSGSDLTSGENHIFEVSNLNGSGAITVAGALQENLSFNVNNLEVWTARNLLYDPAAVETVEASGGLETAGLYDGKTDSLSVENQVQTVTVTFDDPQDIKGIILRGAFPANTPVRFTVNGSDETKYWRRSSSESYKWERIEDGTVGTNETAYYYRYLNLENLSQLTLTISADEDITYSLDEMMVFEGDPLVYVKNSNLSSYERLFAGADPAYRNMIKQVLYNTTDKTLTVENLYKTTFPDNSGEVVTSYAAELTGPDSSSQIFYSSGNRLRDKNIQKKEEISGAFFLDLPMRNIIAEGNPKDLTLTVQEGSIGSSGDLSLIESDSILQKSLFLASSYTGEIPVDMDTPFLGLDENESEIGLMGNPLPYTPLGVDSPRSFAYKMASQATLANPVTAAVGTGETGRENFRNYETGSGKFRPGLMSSSESGYDNNLYSPGKSAGVDSIGFLTGVAAMSGVSLFRTDGTLPTEKLDELYKNPESAAVFGYQDDYRLSGVDLELTTLLVPSFDLARVGDILVSCDRAGGIQDIGFIVKMPDAVPPGAKATDYWTGVKVVSVKRAFKRTTLGVWGLDEKTGANGFSSNPSNYQIRRLVAEKEGSVPGESTVSWEAADNLPANLDYTIAFKTEGEANPEKLEGTDLFVEWVEHFVPNTEEPLILDNITFSLTDSSNREILAFTRTGRDLPVELVSPKDPYYDEAQSEAGNVYNNTGEGIVFGYLTKDNGAWTEYPLMTMKRKAGGSYDMEEELGVSGELILKYNDQNGNYDLGYSEDESARFYVKALDGSRPGDDYLLNFRLKDYPGVVTDKEDDDINFLAVYDKKMLWRANLYIAEEKNDWNDLHPWIVGNEWNRTLSEDDFDDFTDDKLISSLDVGDGGQVIDIAAFTLVRSKNVKTVDGHVAYDYPEGVFKGYDSPFDYVYKMLRQRENTNHYYSNGIFPDLVKLASGATIALSALQNWSKTGSPSSQWRNYRRAASGGYEPYLPGLGLYKHSPNHDLLEEELKGQYNYFITDSPHALSAGVDCIGFAKRSASYDDASYSWGKVDGNITEGAAADTRNNDTYPYVGIDSYVISGDDFAFINNDDVLNYYHLEKLVPGDVFYYKNADRSMHTAVVQEITYPDDTRQSNNTKIKFIESYYDGSDTYVNNIRILTDIGKDDGRKWYIVRLK